MTLSFQRAGAPGFARTLVVFGAFLAAAFSALYPTSAKAQLISAGDSFRLVFDLSGSPLQPPYSEIHPILNFAAADPLQFGDGYTVQIFDSANNPLSNQSVWLWTQSFDAYNTELGVQLSGPSSTAQGYILFTEIFGSFILESAQGVIAYEYPVQPPIQSTFFVPATVQINHAVPEPSAFGLIGVACLLAIAGIKKLRRAKE